MKIDEVIADCKENDLWQLAEWLEDYKRLKELFSKTFIKDCNTCEQEIYQKAYKEGQDKGFSDGHFFGYNKAIDDFVKFASDMPTVETEDGTIRPMWLEEIAEQLCGKYRYRKGEELHNEIQRF